MHRDPCFTLCFTPCFIRYLAPYSIQPKDFQSISCSFWLQSIPSYDESLPSSIPPFVQLLQSNASLALRATGLKVACSQSSLAVFPVAVCSMWAALYRTALVQGLHRAQMYMRRIAILAGGTHPWPLPSRIICVCYNQRCQDLSAWQCASCKQVN